MEVTIQKLQKELKPVFENKEVEPQNLYLMINDKPVVDYKDLESGKISLICGEKESADDVTWSELERVFKDQDTFPMQYEESGKPLGEASLERIRSGRSCLIFKVGK